MTTEQKIKHIACNNIHLPECPVKKQHAIAQRIVLARDITNLLNEVAGLDLRSPMDKKPGPTNFKAAV